MAGADAVKQLKVKTSAVSRLMKDRVASDREIEGQKERIGKVRSDPEKDEHDVRKQGEVLQEYVDGLADELTRLEKAWEELKKYIATLQDEQSEVTLRFVASEEVGERRRRRVDGDEVAARLGRCEAVERRARVLDERRVVAAGGHRLRRRGEWKCVSGVGRRGRRPARS